MLSPVHVLDNKVNVTFQHMLHMLISYGVSAKQVALATLHPKSHWDMAGIGSRSHPSCLIDSA